MFYLVVKTEDLSLSAWDTVSDISFFLFFLVRITIMNNLNHVKSNFRLQRF